MNAAAAVLSDLGIIDSGTSCLNLWSAVPMAFCHLGSALELYFLFVLISLDTFVTGPLLKVAEL